MGERSKPTQTTNMSETIQGALVRSYADILKAVVENPDAETTKNTPARAATAMQFCTSGYRQQLQDVIGEAVFLEDSRSMVIVRDLDFCSLCEHHLLPFVGKVHIAYLPSGRILGLSKFARIVDMFSRRLQVQERLTAQIAEAIQQTLNPAGVAVVIEAKHMCMMMRGVQKMHSATATSHTLGAFRESPQLHQEFLALATRSSRL
eukprot:c13231_g1_i1.p1 GENE.c13231_g1_i1~~c13231_g1_i1.p1  ORF type:complete len:205 (+),score=48.00 c13231_g1_i1:3-617(+)